MSREGKTCQSELSAKTDAKRNECLLSGTCQDKMAKECLLSGTYRNKMAQECLLSGTYQDKMAQECLLSGTYQNKMAQECLLLCIGEKRKEKKKPFFLSFRLYSVSGLIRNTKGVRGEGSFVCIMVGLA